MAEQKIKQAKASAEKKEMIQHPKFSNHVKKSDMALYNSSQPASESFVQQLRTRIEDYGRFIIEVF